jgi:hypothetical protein
MRTKPNVHVLTLLLTAIALINPPPALAWIDTGHKIVALIAWKELTPKSRAAIIELLKQHPRYEKDLLAGAEEGATPEQLAEHAFAVASVWPDIIRAQEHPMHATFHHSSWHYITIPFEDGAKAVIEPPTGPGPHDVVEALTHCTAELKDPAAAAPAKAARPEHTTEAFTWATSALLAGVAISVVWWRPLCKQSKAALIKAPQQDAEQSEVAPEI